jgi:hypothetical protein
MELPPEGVTLRPEPDWAGEPLKDGKALAAEELEPCSGSRTGMLAEGRGGGRRP